ncbi:MAG: adaptor protein MecA [Oscillospiraceae bacterium]|nr:adaptor protein MecA [Oscillospiraceae bacterium]
MNVQTVGRDSYLVTVTRDELCCLDISPDLTEGDAVRIIRMALPDGAEPLSGLFVEVYPGRDEFMVFARIGGSVTAVYRFSGFEDLLAGVKLCPDMFRSELYRDGGRYILIMTPWEGADVPTAVGEYGDRLQISESLLPHLREQLQCVIRRDAVSKLCGAF